MGSFFWSLAAFIVAIAILITIHEFGHFWVARRCGVWVERFSIGFGPAIWRRKDKKGTEFVVAVIPLGGYVKMLDSRVEAVPESRHHEAFNFKTVGQRSAIIAAGPIANFLFAIVAYWLVFMHGVPALKPIIGQVVSGSIAEQAQLIPGMELNAVDGIETPDWDAARLALISKIGDASAELKFTLHGQQGQIEKKVDLQQWKFDPEKQDPLISLGLVPVQPKIEQVLAEVQKNSPADKAGLQAGDRIVRVNGQPIIDWASFAKTIRDNPRQPIPLEVERRGGVLALTLTPEVKPGSSQEGFAGVIPRVEPLPDAYKTEHRYGPFSALTEATTKSWQLIKLTVTMLGKLVVGDIKLNSLSGPISIAQGAGASAGYGMIYYLMFLALISVNLGIINLVPLPVLDGGHLLFLLMEKIKGKPVSERVQEFGYRIGSLLLILLMGLALFNDFSRL
ncbi:sigma E protease regulator RseP [Rosenbergiella australiborealis]|uniref:Zinc metalloprotease n=1 Tax=Rosenbergiella australiborealis TaxID=1544696 RepID=A0ABS5T1P6_9GAMM|nr:sigma E protease regulator RseP [Rosenbergiella australiborealis]MBT0726250.1 sigma E protease regulator RseP [Rosenbergiella australiborealis]